MKAKDIKAKMDKWVEIRKLLARLDREIIGIRTTLKELDLAVNDENSCECTVELSEDEADGFHGKSYEAFKEIMEAEARSYDKDE